MQFFSGSSYLVTSNLQSILGVKFEGLNVFSQLMFGQISN